MNFPRRLPALWLLLALALPAWAQDARRVDPDHLRAYWILLNQQVDVDVPNSGRNLDKPVCAAVSYTIGADGVPRELKLEKVMPASDLGQAALSAVSHFRYGPALENRHSEPVRTYYVVPFNAPAGADAQQQLMAPCRLAGYAPD
jgi:hypothetical protein